ncbi:MAG: GNAT family N-acetyltransferase [Oceanospirillaceae bacterium]|nr:GNAT family N-acetyltransferase [Oceanospirillaceae bacterium]MBT14302.1 GNAT family N-acetyltransferase [Oceanospirillaceae bacterium]|tara:strand:- start:252 stop:497 length:246 start_codon:yes stop_codon:yes gene_type:complete
MADFQIEHQPAQSRFVLRRDNKECVLDYRLSGAWIDFTHTYVPFALRGQGLAEALVKEGLAWARAQNYQLTASCWYVQKFL